MNAKGQWQIQNPIIQKLLKKNKKTKQCQWLLRQLRFQYRNCCVIIIIIIISMQYKTYGCF